MPRPPKCRRVAYLPGVTAFSPVGVPEDELDEVVLSVEELEAIRLKDVEGLDQELGSREMGISRPTFQRILSTARAKVADALVNGKVIRIEGGVYSFAGGRRRCRHCGKEFDAPTDDFAGNEADRSCPGCGKRASWCVVRVHGCPPLPTHGRRHHCGGPDTDSDQSRRRPFEQRDGGDEPGSE